MLRTAARSMAAKKGIQDEDGLALRMMLETVTALRMFVNDELNELQFAISAVAENMLKPGKRSIVLLSSVHIQDFPLRCTPMASWHFLHLSFAEKWS